MLDAIKPLLDSDLINEETQQQISEAWESKLNEAREQGLDITADIYPYDGWQAPMAILMPSRDYTDRRAAEYALESIASPSSITITYYEGEPTYVGKTLAELANKDPLTKLPNRRLFDERLQQAAIRSKRTGKTFALLFS